MFEILTSSWLDSPPHDNLSQRPPTIRVPPRATSSSSMSRAPPSSQPAPVAVSYSATQMPPSSQPMPCPIAGSSSVRRSQSSNDPSAALVYPQLSSMHRDLRD